jgi:hypothetical protein
MSEPPRRFPAPWHADKIPGGRPARHAAMPGKEFSDGVPRGAPLAFQVAGELGDCRVWLWSRGVGCH